MTIANDDKVAEPSSQTLDVAQSVDALLEAARYADMEDLESLAALAVPLDSKDSQGRTVNLCSSELLNHEDFGQQPSMADNIKAEIHNEYKVVENPFSYGSTMKLDGHNYEIWSCMFMMSVVGHRKKHIIEEDEPAVKMGKYATWKEDNNIVMSWIMNSVQPDIAHSLAYYMTAKHMWTFLRQTYSYDKNVFKILQVEEELFKLQQGDMELSQYFALVKSSYEQLKGLRPPCQACYKTHYEPTMVAKFLAGLSPKFEVAKALMLTGAEIPDLAEAYNRLSRLAVYLSQPQSEAPAAALAMSGGHGQASRGRGSSHGARGQGRFQCTYCGKFGHLEDRCWDKHGRLASTSQSRRFGALGGRGTFTSHTPIGSAHAGLANWEDDWRRP
ncbi:uncharacterized protein LOC116247807 isoform X1 [Nymphaea colorata]|nr:uncharacterized protein LOC116247807 isoform X1 [Nymphaea colorata]